MNNNGPTLLRSPIPLLKQRPEMVQAIAVDIRQLIARADRDGFGTQAYLLEMAAVEADRAAEQSRRDMADRLASPKDLWEPQR